MEITTRENILLSPFKINSPARPAPPPSFRPGVRICCEVRVRTRGVIRSPEVQLRSAAVEHQGCTALMKSTGATVALLKEPSFTILDQCRALYPERQYSSSLSFNYLKADVGVIDFVF
ncbi:hypothetical protein EVAR_28996_1 [Eumeta japonica]|uniref:Uncharacterized protein n=1 Tax=Eumeta variegata TaxID=151549 RepID=A0A4C1W1R4_EUMVA|nr:hypothetical protein EVAR_28996_1 [Eumeta japonica]